MMKAAFAYWDKRIAPVFDTARQIHLVEAESGRILVEAPETLPDDLPVQKVLRLTELRVGTLVCGAISRPLHELVSAYGIRVIPFVAGDLRQVIQAWLQGRLTGDTFAMPGCRGRGGRNIQGRRFNEVEDFMFGKRGSGQGMGMGQGVGQVVGQGQGQGRGKGQGRGPGAQRSGRGGRSVLGDGLGLSGNMSICQCPQCGHREPHERGVPCVARQCPQCGAAMNRG